MPDGCLAAAIEWELTVVDVVWLFDIQDMKTKASESLWDMLLSLPLFMIFILFCYYWQ